MILITSSAPINNICGVCKDNFAALDYLRTIAKAPIKATNGKYGTEQIWLHDGEPRFKECEESPCEWKFIVDNVAYYLTPVDYFE